MEVCCCSSPSTSLSVHSIKPRLPFSDTHSRPRTISSASLRHYRPLSFLTGRTNRAPVPSLRRSSHRGFTVSAVFERFTERAIKAVVFSQKEAKALGRAMVFTQHLLLGLVAEDRSPDGFLGSGITIDRAREAVLSIWGLGDGEESGDGLATSMPFSKSTKRVFEAAVERSRTLKCNFISPEHIVLGLFDVDNGSADQVLESLGVNVNHLASVALSRLQGELAKDGRELPPAALSEKVREKSPRWKTTILKSPEKKEDKSALAQFCVDLTARASEGLIDPVIGRDNEVQRVIQILCRRTKNNPILLGDPGVGKTAIAEGMANNIANGDVPIFLMGKKIMSLDVGLLMAGAKERGELEARVTGLISEVKRSASTTIDEHRLHFEKDKALARRFQPVLINEPSQEDAVKILLGLREKYEAYHRCQFNLDAINAAVYLSARYIPDRYLPDKAIDLIDEAGSRARMDSFKKKKEQEICILSKTPNEYWREIRAVQAMHEVTLADKLKYSLDQSSVDDDGVSGDVGDAKLIMDFPMPSTSEDEEDVVVGTNEIATVASLWSGIPVQQLTADEANLLVDLDEQLKERVVGQDDAVIAISRAVKRSRVGLKDPDRPIAAMLFCGPTGVGKTELTKALAACYFGSENAMLRLDMSEYMERHTVSKLIGSPPGYVGYGDGGTLTEAIRRRPFTVLLLDEVEKAHPDIFNILLQVFEDGHLTDSQGRKVCFKNTLIVMTSNIGSTAIAKGRRNNIGFFIADEVDSSYLGMKALVMEELKAYFQPELLNRIDEVVVFRPLEQSQMLQILNIMLQDVKSRLLAHGVSLEVSDAVMDLVSHQGYDKSYGARPLRRAITQLIEDVISESMLSEEYQPGDVAVIDVDASGKPFVSHQSDSTVHLIDAASTF
ncbi:hypothetical protein QJS04_geneDACA021039 [Acorus gramineus]|uniref:Clp R domain-containing protein n=1 Tax=Acorus gramineus TaxID=55184 RepID=A0AAV9B1X8_ACOGR|nr:hypothetical protein QJS04_geneDACA021039 [Acorus gramineus]